jgi:hypothetical protein
MARAQRRTRPPPAYAAVGSASRSVRGRAGDGRELGNRRRSPLRGAVDQTAPGRTGGTVAANDVDFGGMS